MKRQYNGPGTIIARGPKRPVEKIVGVHNAVVTNSQTAGLNILPGVACTYSGGTLTISTTWNNTVSTAAFYWALVFLREGQTLSSLSIANNTVLYEPSQDVLACGCANAIIGATDNQDTIIKEYKLKSMRKMKEGDGIVFTTLGNSAGIARIDVVFTAFFKE